MKTLKLKSMRLVQLAQLIGQIPSKDLATVEDIKINVNLTNDLDNANKLLSEKVKDFNVKRNELLAPYQKEYQEKSKDLSEEEAKKLASELDVKFAEANKDFMEKENKEINELGDTEIVVELSDEKFAKMKTWFEKYSIEKSQDKKFIVEVATALE